MPFFKKLLWYDFETSLEPGQESALLGQLGWDQLGRPGEEGSWVSLLTATN